MGLDITAYAEAIEQPEGDYSEKEPHLGRDYILAHAYEGFEASAAGLTLGRWYQVERLEALQFRAGSYVGYGIWRKALAELAGYKAEDAWNNPEGHRDAPFFLLVNFADNEGTIGPEAASDLSCDFTSLHTLMRHQWKGCEEFQVLYRQWTAAFCLASDGGIVDLH